MPKNINNIFDLDVALKGGYQYTTNNKLSSYLANQRQTQATIDMVKLSGRQVIDVGCGDGTYTNEIFVKCHPKKMVGFDLSRKAIAVASKRYSGNKNLHFFHGDVYSLPKQERFDCAILRGVLHHVDDPKRALAAIACVCDEMFIIEPNGYNPILKLIEKISLYHRVHKERSYPLFKLKKWLSSVGFNVVSCGYVGLVPFFCPDIIARLLKKLEPFFENLFLFKTIICGVYVIHSRKVK